MTTRPHDVTPLTAGALCPTKVRTSVQRRASLTGGVNAHRNNQSVNAWQFYDHMNHQSVNAWGLFGTGASGL